MITKKCDRFIHTNRAVVKDAGPKGERNSKRSGRTQLHTVAEAEGSCTFKDRHSKTTRVGDRALSNTPGERQNRDFEWVCWGFFCCTRRRFTRNFISRFDRFLRTAWWPKQGSFLTSVETEGVLGPRRISEKNRHNDETSRMKCGNVKGKMLKKKV